MIVSVTDTCFCAQRESPKTDYCDLFDLTALSRSFSAKVTLEHQLPTSTQKLKVTDECILAALISMVTCTSKVGHFYAYTCASKVGSLDSCCVVNNHV